MNINDTNGLACASSELGTLARSDDMKIGVERKGWNPFSISTFFNPRFMKSLFWSAEQLRVVLHYWTEYNTGQLHIF